MVDEYDAPLLNVLDDAEKLQQLREMMREFYSPLIALEPELCFVFLTGITKFSQLSVFSELNNLQNITMVPKYAGICGITETELQTAMQPDIAYLADALGKSVPETYQALARMYDGYRFCWPSEGVYNPFSLVSALDQAKLGSYWYSSGTPSSLIRLITTRDITPDELDKGIFCDSYAFDIPIEGATPELSAFLYQAGYVTIKSYDEQLDTYELAIPNDEVRDSLFKSLLPAYSGLSATSQSSMITRFARFILQNDMDAALMLLRSFLAGIPYDLAPKDEKAFQALLYLLFKVVGLKIHAEVRTATGRIDLLLENTTTLFVIELKYAGSAQEALEQIDTKDYALPWQASSKQVVKVGVNFSPEKRTIEEGWIIAE